MIEAKKSSEKVFANTVIDLTRSGHWLEHRRLSQKLFLKKYVQKLPLRSSKLQVWRANRRFSDAVFKKV